MTVDQHGVLLDILDKYECYEEEILPFEVAEFCDEYNVSLRDEQQIYVHLYGIHEQMNYNMGDHYQRYLSSRLMQEFDDAVQACDERIANDEHEIPVTEEPIVAPEWMTTHLMDLGNPVQLYNNANNYSPITRPCSLNTLPRST